MAIKIIKHGQKPKFNKTCPNCGCEFEYEMEDLQVESNWSLTSCSYPTRRRRVVICPECGEKLYHDTIVDDIYPTWPNVVYCNDNKTSTGYLDCATCPNRPNPDKPTIGDSPCTWCPKMQPYCTTTTSTGIDFNNTTSYTGIKVETPNIPGNYTTEEK